MLSGLPGASETSPPPSLSLCLSVSLLSLPPLSRTHRMGPQYCPGSNSVLSGLPGGMFEPGKHASLLHAARDELNEEAGASPTPPPPPPTLLRSPNLCMMGG